MVLVRIDNMAGPVGYLFMNLVTAADPLHEIQVYVWSRIGVPIPSQRLLAGPTVIRNWHDLEQATTEDGRSLNLTVVRRDDFFVDLLRDLERSDDPLHWLANACAEAKDDREIVKAAVEMTMGEAFRHASLDLKADRRFVLEVVGDNGLALAHAVDALKDDSDVVDEAIGHTPAAFQFASSRIRCRRDTVIRVVKVFSQTLEFTDLAFRADRGVVMAALDAGQFVLQYASEDLKADKDVVLAALEEDGHSLQYASWPLKRDRDVVLAAVINNGSALVYAHASLKSDRQIVMTAVSTNGEALALVDPGNEHMLWDDFEVVMAAVTNGGGLSLRHASPRLRSDRAIVSVAVTDNGEALRYASDELKADRRVALLAISSWAGAYRHCALELRQDANFQADAEATVPLRRHWRSKRRRGRAARAASEALVRQSLVASRRHQESSFWVVA
jgi:hypothetical protein